MIRAFAAIALPEAVRFDLMLLQQGLPLPRPVPAENLHLTLLFLGEVPPPVLADIDLAFRAVRAPGFALALAGVGLFGGRKPRVVYAGVAASPALRHLQGKVETAARGAGFGLPARKFVPHVTLARLPERLEGRERLERAVAGRGGYGGPVFPVEDFRLFRSHLAGSGAIYEELGRYPLSVGQSALE
jgi:2'-5' RNA ligase